MSTCDVCGNDYDNPLTITQGDRSGVFDSFECAVHAMAPTCAHCGCRVLGHGVHVGDETFCCANCSREGANATGVTDRV